MTSVGSFFLYPPLTSDEIKNVVRLSPRRNGKSTMSPVQFPARFLPRLRKHIGPEPSSGRGKKRPYPPVSREHDDEYFSYRHAPPNHLGFPSSPSRKRRTILLEPWKTLKRVEAGRSVSYLTELDSGAMINSLLPENYRTLRIIQFQLLFHNLIK